MNTSEGNDKLFLLLHFCLHLLLAARVLVPVLGLPLVAAVAACGLLPAVAGDATADWRRIGCRGCRSRTPLSCGKWGLPGPGTEPAPPAFAAAFFTTGPPGKPYKPFLMVRGGLE